MRQTERRLEALEVAAQQKTLLGYRIFIQSLSEPEQYFEGVRGNPGQPYTRAEIDALSAAGWQCIVICYKDSGQASAIRLRWGDDSQAPEPREPEYRA